MSTSVGDISSLIGHTPLLAIDYLFDGIGHTVYAKYEQKNMTGSIKDRMVLHILDAAYNSGSLSPGDTIVETSSGNTGISFAYIGRALGHPVRIYMPDWMSNERVRLICNTGAEVISVSKVQGGFLGSIAMSKEYAKDRDDVFLPMQFDNVANITAHYESTGPEIETQLAKFGVSAHAFVAGVGTGGTAMGVGQYLRRNNSEFKIHPLEPANSPTLRTGCKSGSHRIQGISDEFIPGIVNLEYLDEVIDIWDGDSILMAQSLCSIGLGVGISSGANFLGAVQITDQMGPGAIVATVFPDSNKKYLSTDLCRFEPMEDHYLSSRMELLRFRTT